MECVGLTVNQKIDTFEIFNPWNTLHLFLYIQLAFYFYAHCINNKNNFFLFCLKDMEKML